MYYFGGKPDSDVYLPSINIKEAEDLLEALEKDPNIVVIVNMEVSKFSHKNLKFSY